MKGCPTYQHYYEEQALKEDYEHIGLRKGQGDNGQESGGDRIEHWRSDTLDSLDRPLSRCTGAHREHVRDMGTVVWRKESGRWVWGAC